MAGPDPHPAGRTHSRWVQLTHGLVALAFLTLVVTGAIILMSHPRLYWGEVGNDLTPAWLELPISRNHRHGGWEKPVPFFEQTNSPVSANRKFEIFNQNGWGRSLHFLGGWLLVVSGTVYLVMGWWSGHFWRNVLPRGEAWNPASIGQDLRRHFRFEVPSGSGESGYGILQRWAYSVVVFGLFPWAVGTGLAMSPAITAAFPVVATVFGGFQTARSVHFLISLFLILFLVGHLLMVTLSGFWRQVRAITIGN